MITLKKGDITQEDVDVIVNAANTGLRGGGGVDGAIHRVAGPSVTQECRLIGGCKTGEAVMTHAGNLKAKKIDSTPLLFQRLVPVFTVILKKKRLRWHLG